MYHKQRLLFAAIDAILNRVSLEVQQWLDGGPNPRRTVEVFPSNRPQTRANSLFLQEIALSSSRPEFGQILQYGEETSGIDLSNSE